MRARVIGGATGPYVVTYSAVRSVQWGFGGGIDADPSGWLVSFVIQSAGFGFGWIRPRNGA